MHISDSRLLDDHVRESIQKDIGHPRSAESMDVIEYLSLILRAITGKPAEQNVLSLHLQSSLVKLQDVMSAKH